jgi:hypothetical protein
VVGGDSGPARPEELKFGEIWLFDPDTGAATTTKLTKTYDGSVRLAAGTLSPHSTLARASCCGRRAHTPTDSPAAT